MKKKVMIKAWALFRAGEYGSFNAALKDAWKMCKIQNKLNQGETFFAYVKKDGTIRTATGTAIALSGYESRGGQKNTKPSLITYFDTEKQAVRSFNIWQLA